MAYTYHDLIRDLRQGPICFPGGYTKRFVLSDGEWATFEAVKKDLFQVARATRDQARDGFRVIACDVYWEGPTEECALSGDLIESEYGDPNAEVAS